MRVRRTVRNLIRDDRPLFLQAQAERLDNLANDFLLFRIDVERLDVGEQGRDAFRQGREEVSRRLLAELFT